jgi:hypothetical protein
VADGGLKARNLVETIARSADDLHATILAYAALMSWGRSGFDLIVEIAMNLHTVKSKSAAVSLFSIAALDGTIAGPPNWMILPPPFAAIINSRHSREIIGAEALRALRRLILSLANDDLMIPVSQSVMHLGSRPEAVEVLVTALGVKWLRFGSSALDEYRGLIESSPDSEPAFQAFFCRYPQMLDPMAVEVWSQPNFHGALEPDFVVRRADNTYLVVEIECPAKRLVTKGGQLSAETTHAEKQAVEYESFLSSRVIEARHHFPSYRRADCLVLVGIEATLKPDQVEVLEQANHRRQNIRIAGFDWLHSRAATLVENVGRGTIEVHTRHRVV